MSPAEPAQSPVARSRWWTRWSFGDNPEGTVPALSTWVSFRPARRHCLVGIGSPFRHHSVGVGDGFIVLRFHRNEQFGWIVAMDRVVRQAPRRGWARRDLDWSDQRPSFR